MHLLLSPLRTIVLSCLCISAAVSDGGDSNHHHHHHRPQRLHHRRNAGGHHQHHHVRQPLPPAPWEDEESVGSRFVVDLTHHFEMDRMPLMEGGSPLEMILENHDDGNGARSEFYEFCLDERLGTHVNAPSMFLHLNGTTTTDAIPLQMLVRVPAVVVDLPVGPTNRSALLTRHHLDRWELDHGRIPKGSIVLLRTGWSEFYRQPDKFLGNFKGESKQVHPGFSGEAALWLLSDRGVTGLGTECADVELGWKTSNQVKQTLAAQNKISLVQLANLRALPTTGIELTVAPLKLRGGAGGPARVFAVATEEEERRKKNFREEEEEDDDIHHMAQTKRARSPESPESFSPPPSPPRVRATHPGETMRSSAKSVSCNNAVVLAFAIASIQWGIARCT